MEILLEPYQKQIYYNQLHIHLNMFDYMLTFMYSIMR